MNQYEFMKQITTAQVALEERTSDVTFTINKEQLKYLIRGLELAFDEGSIQFPLDSGFKLVFKIKES